ncbi:hypothetical protein [Amycolatopsis anabasis]|uniref:hypothetical protein n=1 Tax=Amycolatopsis anabasis TaxID=1840409 RepID=UPI00131BF2D5|nr:hypothetical protein [Amycolatopsis anabasis]
MVVRACGIVVLAASVFLATACAVSEPKSEVASLEQTAPDRPNGADEFGECMKANGVDLDSAKVEDSAKGSNNGETKQQGGPPGGDSGKRAEALGRCKHLLPDGGAPQPLNADDLERARALAKCMRANGIAYPDPDPNAPGYGAGVTKLPDGVDAKDPVVREKLDHCAKETGGR